MDNEKQIKHLTIFEMFALMSPGAGFGVDSGQIYEKLGLSLSFCIAAAISIILGYGSMVYSSITSLKTDDTQKPHDIGVSSNDVRCLFSSLNVTSGVELVLPFSSLSIDFQHSIGHNFSVNLATSQLLYRRRGIIAKPYLV